MSTWMCDTRSRALSTSSSMEFTASDMPVCDARRRNTSCDAANDCTRQKRVLSTRSGNAGDRGSDRENGGHGALSYLDSAQSSGRARVAVGTNDAKIRVSHCSVALSNNPSESAKLDGSGVRVMGTLTPPRRVAQAQAQAASTPSPHVLFTRNNAPHVPRFGQAHKVDREFDSVSKPRAAHRSNHQVGSMNSSCSSRGSNENNNNNSGCTCAAAASASLVPATGKPSSRQGSIQSSHSINNYPSAALSLVPSHMSCAPSISAGDSAVEVRDTDGISASRSQSDGARSTREAGSMNRVTLNLAQQTRSCSYSRSSSSVEATAAMSETAQQRLHKQNQEQEQPTKVLTTAAREQQQQQQGEEEMCKQVGPSVVNKKIYEVRGPTAPRSLAFQRSCTLGSGGCGHVFKAVLREGSLAAVKELTLESTNPSAFDREVWAMSSLPPHPNCVRYFGARHSRHHYYIIMEYVSGGSIQSLRRSVGPLCESVFQRYAQMTLMGLHHLHTHGIIHRDIKGANVLLDERGCAKIVDFGCCKDVNQSGVTLGGGGTPLWMAPEVCRGEPATTRSDVWSYGCLCLEMTNETGLPWTFPAGMSIPGVIYAIACASKSPPIPTNLSPLAQDMLACCLKINPAERVDVAELLQHPFFMRNYLDEISDDDDTNGLINSRRAARNENGVTRLDNRHSSNDDNGSNHNDNPRYHHLRADSIVNNTSFAGRVAEADRTSSVDGDVVHLNMAFARDGRSSNANVNGNNSASSSSKVLDDDKGKPNFLRLRIPSCTDLFLDEVNTLEDRMDGVGALSPAQQFLQRLRSVYSDSESSSGEESSARGNDNDTQQSQKTATMSHTQPGRDTCDNTPLVIHDKVGNTQIDAMGNSAAVSAASASRTHEHHSAKEAESIARIKSATMHAEAQSLEQAAATSVSSSSLLARPSQQVLIRSTSIERVKDEYCDSHVLQLHGLQRLRQSTGRATAASKAVPSRSDSNHPSHCDKSGMRNKSNAEHGNDLHNKDAMHRAWRGSSSRPCNSHRDPHSVQCASDVTHIQHASRRNSRLDDLDEHSLSTLIDFEETLEMDDNKLMADIIHFARCSADSAHLHDHKSAGEDVTSSPSASASDTVSEDEEEDDRHNSLSSSSVGLRRATARAAVPFAAHAHQPVKPLEAPTPATTSAMHVPHRRHPVMSGTEVLLGRDDTRTSPYATTSTLQKQQQKQLHTPQQKPPQHVVHTHSDACRSAKEVTQQQQQHAPQSVDAMSTETLLWASGGGSCVVRATGSTPKAEHTVRSPASSKVQSVGEALAHVAATRRISSFRLDGGGTMTSRSATSSVRSGNSTLVNDKETRMSRILANDSHNPTHTSVTEPKQPPRKRKNRGFFSRLRRNL